MENGEKRKCCINSPLVDFMQKKLRLGRIAGTLLVFFLILLVFVAIFNFYLILDKDRVQPFLINSISPRYRERTADVMTKMDTALGGFLRGQLALSAKQQRMKWGNPEFLPDVIKTDPALSYYMGLHKSVRRLFYYWISKNTAFVS